MLRSYEVDAAQLLADTGQHRHGHLLDGVLCTRVVPACELTDMAIQMLRARVVADTDVCQFEHNPERLHAVGVNHVVHELLHAVLDRHVRTIDALVSPRLVSEHKGIGFRAFVKETCQCRRIGELDTLGGRLIGGTILDADDGDLPDRSVPGVLLLRFALSLLIAAHVGLIDIHGSAEASRIGVERLSGAVRHVPRGLLCHAQVPLQLRARHTY